MPLITVSDLEDYLGTTFDSATSALYSTIIDAVSAYIECYTDQKFTDAVYAERIEVIDNTFFIKNNVQYIYGTYYGLREVIEVTPGAADDSLFVDINAKSIRAVSHLTVDQTVSTATATLAGLAATLNALSGFTASILDDVNSLYPALTVIPGRFGANPYNLNKIRLIAANEYLNCSERHNGMYETDVECATGIAVYQGGYSTIPADLKDATVRFVLKAYGNRDTATYVGTYNRERIGDYEYSTGTWGALAPEIQSLSINYKDVLGCYSGRYDI